MPLTLPSQDRIIEAPNVEVFPLYEAVRRTTPYPPPIRRLHDLATWLFEFLTYLHRAL